MDDFGGMAPDPPAAIPVRILWLYVECGEAIEQGTGRKRVGIKIVWDKIYFSPYD